jgi:hypothetical protein
MKSVLDALIEKHELLRDSHPKHSFQWTLHDGKVVGYRIARMKGNK